MKKLIKTIKYYDDGSQDTIYHHTSDHVPTGGARPSVYCPQCGNPRYNPYDYGIRTATCFCDTNGWFQRYVAAYSE